MKKILKVDSSYRVIDGEGIEIMDTLPKGVYELKSAEMMGFWLEKVDLEAFPSKVYGCHDRMTDKVIKKYSTISGRNLGVLLSGEKGTGKSLFVRNLSVKMSSEMPVIIIKKNEGQHMLSFLASIRGRCVLVFDEFEKMFRKNNTDSMANCKENDIREQETALSFFDGVEMKQEKLILLTVNETYLMSRYLLGRPGRIYYHFVMTIPSEEEISEYVADNLKSAVYDTKEKIDILASRLAARALSWDSLSAVVSELNNGELLEDTLRDLNIRTDSGRDSVLIVNARYSDGEEREETINCSDSSGEIKIVYQRYINKAKFGKDSMWTTLKFKLEDLVPDKLGRYKVVSFKQDPALDDDDNIIENAPTIVHVTAGNASAIRRASMITYPNTAYML